MHGINKTFAGAAVYEQTMQCSFTESRLLLIRDSLVSWLEFARSVRNTTGSYWSDYAGQADLVLYDDRNNAIRTIRHFGFYPEKVESSPVDGTQGSAVVKVNCTFKYFYWSDQ